MNARRLLIGPVGVLGFLTIALFETPAAAVSSMPGDYNGNGIVDAADYAVWRESSGEQGVGMPADGDGDGEVGKGDYDLWKANYGNRAPLPATPEASAFVIWATLGLITGLAATNRRRR